MQRKTILTCFKKLIVFLWIKWSGVICFEISIFSLFSLMFYLRTYDFRNGIPSTLDSKRRNRGKFVYDFRWPSSDLFGQLSFWTCRRPNSSNTEMSAYCVAGRFNYDLRSLKRSRRLIIQTLIRSLRNINNDGAPVWRRRSSAYDIKIITAELERIRNELSR